MEPKLLHRLHAAACHFVLVRVDVVSDVLDKLLVLRVRACAKLEQRTGAVRAVVRVPTESWSAPEPVVERGRTVQKS